jgi:nucleoside-diphosphate kinase
MFFIAPFQFIVSTRMFCVACRNGETAVEPFRQLCGPADPEVAKVLRPHSLRARYGRDRSRNALHCTDLEEDGPLEVDYFFKILQAAG